MAHGRFHARQIDAAGDEQRSVRMPQIVEPHRLKSGGVTGALETTAEGRGIQTTAEAISEHVVVRAGELATAPQTLERRRGLISKRNLPRSTALGRAELHLARQRTANDDLPAHEVDVTPAKRDELAAAKAGVCRHAYQLCVLRIVTSAGGCLIVTDGRTAGISMSARREGVRELF